MLASCQKDIKFDVKPFEPKIVLNSYIEADSIISVHVSRSWTMGENITSNLLYNADVALYINDILQPPLQSNHPESHTFNPNKWATHISSSIAQTGDNIRIEVNNNGYPQAYAEVIVPVKTPIISIDTISFPDEYNNQYIRCLINIKDPEPGHKNYFRLTLEYETYNDSGERQIYGEDFISDQDQALSDEFRNINDEIFSTGHNNAYGIFTDDIFDGQEYTLNIHFSPDNYSPNPRYTFKVISLSPSAYLYMKSQIISYFAGENIITEPSAIHTNIQNGLGILTALSTSTTIFNYNQK
jgi:hypothetical protein